jgi:hypothetical protein
MPQNTPNTDPPTSSTLRKASFNLPEAELEKLRALAARRQITVTQALREAIADSDFLAAQQDARNDVLIKTADGEISKVHFAGRS